MWITSTNYSCIDTLDTIVTMASKIESASNANTSYSNALSITTKNSFSTNFESGTGTAITPDKLFEYNLTSTAKTVTVESVNITNQSYQNSDIVQGNETLEDFYVGTDIESVVLNLNYTYSISGQSQINYTLDGNGFDVPIWVVFDDQNLTLTLNTTGILDTKNFTLQSSYLYFTHNMSFLVRVIN